MSHSGLGYTRSQERLKHGRRRQWRARLKGQNGLCHLGDRNPEPVSDCLCDFLLSLGRCPLWVISVHHPRSDGCPLYPRKRTSLSKMVMSALCQKRTHALHKWTSSVRNNEIPRTPGVRSEGHRNCGDHIHAVFICNAPSSCV